MPSVEIFFSYAHEDEELMHEVRRQLVLFDRQEIIRKWHDRLIPPGTEWQGQIDARLQSSDIILLFISPDFFESDYAYDIEMTEALRRHEAGTARVIPVILRPCPWQNAPFAHLQVLPTDGRPVSLWPDRDEACLNVAEGVMRVVHEIRGDSVDLSALRSVVRGHRAMPEVQRTTEAGSQLAFWIFGGALLAALLIVLFRLPELNDDQRKIIRLIMAAASGFIVYLFLGPISLRGRWAWIRAVASLVPYVLIQFVIDPFAVKTKVADVVPAVVASDPAMISAQEELKSRGFYRGEVTGIADSETREAIRAFQQSKDLAPDGYLGSETVRRLDL